MDSSTPGDVARQVAVVAGVVFQTIGSGLAPAGTDVGALSDANRTLVVPADYAFVIWGPIFLLCLAYAVYQALPAQRADAYGFAVLWALVAVIVNQADDSALTAGAAAVGAVVVAAALAAGVARPRSRVTPQPA